MLLIQPRNCEVNVDCNPAPSVPGQEKDVATPSKRFKLAWTEMTGRRPTMEDAFLLKGCFLENDDIDLFGVFDGHAGNAAARYSACKLI